MRRRSYSFILIGLLSVAVGAADSPPVASQPTTASADRAVSTERLNALLDLVEGQNSPEARRTGVREMLRTGADEAPRRLSDLLTRSEPAARVAIAEVLAESPSHLDPLYLDPLMRMVVQGDDAERLAAVNALATYPPEQGVARLRALLLDPASPLKIRMQATAALGRLARRATVEVLAEIIALPKHPLAPTALAALEQATGMRFDGNLAAAHDWWAKQETLSTVAWQQLQMQRLVAQQRQQEHAARELEERLHRALRHAYQRAPDAERPALLASYLSDALPAVQALGLELAQALVAEGRPLSGDLDQRVRALLTASAPRVRAGAVRVVAAQGRAADADTFAEMLRDERSAAARTALAAGLAHLGAPPSIPVLLDLLERDEPQIVAEALTAIGRIVERHSLPDDLQPQVAAALGALYARTDASQNALRERALWAMGRVGAAEFAPMLVAALDAGENVAVRQAAVRGLAAIDDPQYADALTAAAADPDPVVRRQAVELLARWAAQGSSDAILQALWARLGAAQEPDEAVRRTAWEGAKRVLAGRTADQLERWLAQLPGEGDQRRRRTAELLRLQIADLADANAPAALGRAHLRLGRTLRELAALDEALPAYRAALLQLRAAGETDAVQGVAEEYVLAALLHDRYDAELARALAQLEPPLDGASLWDALRPEFELRQTPEQSPLVQRMLAALRDPPTPTWPTETVRAFAVAFEQTQQKRLQAQRVTAALQSLHADPNDPNAVAVVRAHGAAELRQVRDALRSAISDDSPQPALERRLHQLLRELAPEWTGYGPEAATEDKLRALDQLNS